MKRPNRQVVSCSWSARSDVVGDGRCPTNEEKRPVTLPARPLYI
jgi:hypothetical protein